jgi:hypothetical protein
VSRAVLVALLALLAGAAPAAAWDGCTPKAGDVRFFAADGTRLAGHAYGSGTAIVLVHPSATGRCAGGARMHSGSPASATAR